MKTIYSFQTKIIKLTTRLITTTFTLTLCMLNNSIAQDKPFVSNDPTLMNPEMARINPDQNNAYGTSIVISEFYTICNKDHTSKIFWKSQFEPNNTRYTILKSNDNFFWTEIGTLNGINCGTSQYLYSFTDENPNATTTYYTLTAAVMLNPLVSLSEMGVIAGPVEATLCFIPDEYNLSIYPNPSNSIVYGKIDGLKENQKCLFTIYNESGLPMPTINGIQNDNSFYIDIQKLKPGRYMLLVEIQGVTRLSRLLIKI
jgi:hypothetical protein